MLLSVLTLWNLALLVVDSAFYFLVIYFFSIVTIIKGIPTDFWHNNKVCSCSDPNTVLHDGALILKVLFQFFRFFVCFEGGLVFVASFFFKCKILFQLIVSTKKKQL